MSARLRTDFFVGALTRRAQAGGAYVTIARRGAEEAGAIFVVVDRRDGSFDLYAPAPQSVFGTDAPPERLFTRVLSHTDDAAISKRFDSEMRFDPDLWRIDIEDRDGRAFIETAREGPDPFTSR